MAKYCVKCGQELSENVKFCTNCGQEVVQENNVNYNDNTTVNQTVNHNSKSKIAAGLFGIFFGTFGVHNFYLGYTNKAVTQLLLGTVGALLCGMGPVASAIWGFVEGILILTGSINVDASGNPLHD